MIASVALAVALETGKVCQVKTVCHVPHVVKPKPILDRALVMCLKMDPIILLMPAPTTDWMNISIPDSPLSPEPAWVTPISFDDSTLPSSVEIPVATPPIVYSVPVTVTEPWYEWSSPPSLPRPPSVGITRAPEIDPSSAASGLTLLAGLLLVVRGRK